MRVSMEVSDDAAKIQLPFSPSAKRSSVAEKSTRERERESVCDRYSVRGTST